MLHRKRHRRRSKQRKTDDGYGSGGGLSLFKNLRM